jgi:DNA-binding response OmpR family regulator
MAYTLRYRGYKKMNIVLKKILIVEDNVLLVEVMAYILTNKGYEVFTLPNGSDVFNNIKTNHPDLVIIDAVLPGINGKEICQLMKLNNTTRNLPVIICSGDDAAHESLNKKGAPDDILQKPFDINIFLQKVECQLAA